MPVDKRLGQYPEIKHILDRLRGGRPSEVIIVFIPSHDRDGNELPAAEQAKWAKNGMLLFGTLFHGATAFRNLDGIYFDKDMQASGLRPDWDKPIMIQSLAETPDVKNKDNLVRAAQFFRAMGTALNQRCVGVVINNKYFSIATPQRKENQS